MQMMAQPGDAGAIYPKISIFGASPATIRPGAEVLLRWDCVSAATVSIRNMTNGQTLTSTTELQGTFVVKPAQTSEYQLTATSEKGEITAAVTVVVEAVGRVQYAPFIFHGAGNSAVLVLTNTTKGDLPYQLDINADPNYRGIVSSGSGVIAAGRQAQFVFPDQPSSSQLWGRVTAPLGIEGVVYHRQATVGQTGGLPLSDSSTPLREASAAAALGFDHTLSFSSLLVFRNPGQVPVTIEYTLADAAGTSIGTGRLVVAAGAMGVTPSLTVSYPRAANVRGTIKAESVSPAGGKFTMDCALLNAVNPLIGSPVRSGVTLNGPTADCADGGCAVSISSLVALEPEKVGAPVVLRWSTTNAESVRVTDEDGNLIDESSNGTASVTPPAERSMYSYGVTATGGNQIVTRRIWVVIPAPAAQ